jgi:hypothetical protein
MTFTSSTQEKTVAQSRECDTTPVESVYIEETPCLMFTAVNIPREFAQPRTMHEWLT